MTREQAKKKLTDLGISEPTEEQVTKYLDSVAEETKAEKIKMEKYKADAQKADELQKKLDDLEAGNLSEIEKANKAVEDAVKANSDLQRQLNEMKFSKNLADKGITGEKADSIVKAFMSGDFETATASIGQIISEREASAAQAKEKEIFDKSSNPGGGSGGRGKEDEKPDDVKNAEMITFGEKETSAKDYYVLK